MKSFSRVGEKSIFAFSRTKISFENECEVSRTLPNFSSESLINMVAMFVFFSVPRTECGVINLMIIVMS